jgi:hypothetical protein
MLGASSFPSFGKGGVVPHAWCPVSALFWQMWDPLTSRMGATSFPSFGEGGAVPHAFATTPAFAMKLRVFTAFFFGTMSR